MKPNNAKADTRTYVNKNRLSNENDENNFELFLYIYPTPATAANVHFFSLLPGANELVMGCESVCTVESRNFSSFNADQQNAIEMLKRNFILTGTKWIFFASTQHQHQLALLFDSISARFYPFIERRVVMYRCKKESPDNLPVLEPLSRLGLEAYLLLKVNSDDFVCYYIMVETLPYMIGMMYWGIYRPLSPWYLDCHNACWRFTKQMYDHPNNAHIKEQIGDLLALFTFRPYGGQPAWCAPEETSTCKHETLGVK